LKKDAGSIGAALFSQFDQKLSRPVGRTVVNDHDLFLDLHRLYQFEDSLDGRALVVNRHDDRKLRRAMTPVLHRMTSKLRAAKKK